MLLFVVGVCSALADTVTFNGADFSDKGTSGTGKSISTTKSGITLAFSKGYVSSDAEIRKLIFG